jgi:hypothetical protein
MDFFAIIPRREAGEVRRVQMRRTLLVSVGATRHFACGDWSWMER